MDSQKPPRRPCFIEEDDGLASVAEMKAAGFSGSNQNISRPQIHYNTIAMQRKNSLRNLSGYNSGYVSSPRSVNATMRFYEEPLQPHFLEACFLCKKQLGCNKDIFMYRGDTPFCSEECRQEQIEVDEAREKTLSLSASVRAMRKKEQRKSNSSPNKNTTDCSYRSSTVAAA